jgi:hypothetical protein
MFNKLQAGGFLEAFFLGEEEELSEKMFDEEKIGFWGEKRKFAKLSKKTFFKKVMNDRELRIDGI